MNKISTLFAALLCVMTQMALAQISITSSSAITQDFNTLPTTGVQSANPFPTGWYRYDDPTSSAKDTIRVTAGSAQSGGFYSAGTGTNSDRAFGLLYSQSVDPLYLGAKFVNNTGSTIVSATVSYKCEQWRRGNNTLNRFDTLLFEYSYDADSVHHGSWTNVASLLGRSKDSSTSVGSLDGNAIFRNVSGTISGLNIPASSTFWIRFNDKDMFGTDDILAVDDFSISFTTGSLPACTTPAANATSLVLTPTSTSVSGSFTASASADKYLVVYSTSPTLGQTPADGNSYASSSAFGSGTVVQSSGNTSFNVTGLTPSTPYYFSVFAYNDACTGGPKYKTPALAGNTTTLVPADPPCAEPDTITGITVTGTTNNSITATFTPHSGGADGYLVVYRKNSSFLVGVNDGNTYTVGQLLTQVNGAFTDSSYVGYIGTNTTFTITGLELGTNYYFAVFPFNNTSCTGGPNYKVRFSTNVNKTNATTTGGACIEPNSVPQNLVFSSVTGTTITGHFKQQVIADGYVVVIAKGFIANLRDSVNYTVGDSVGNSPKTYVAKIATTNVDTNFTITGLSPNTSYSVAVYSYKVCDGFKLYKSQIVPTVNKRDTTTATGTGIRNAAATTFSVFPNPVQSGELSVLFKQPLSEPAVMEVVDVSGRRLLSEQLPVNVKIQTIDVSAFAKGIYLVNIRYKNENSTISFLVE